MGEKSPAVGSQILECDVDIRLIEATMLDFMNTTKDLVAAHESIIRAANSYLQNKGSQHIVISITDPQTGRTRGFALSMNLLPVKKATETPPSAAGHSTVSSPIEQTSEEAPHMSQSGSIPDKAFWVASESSNVKMFYYDQSNRELWIEYKKTNRIYVYSSVSLEIYQGLLDASSHGSYINKYVKVKEIPCREVF